MDIEGSFLRAIVLCLVTLTQMCLGFTSESRLRNDLFKEYDMFSRPAANWTDPLSVHLEFTPLYLNGLSGANQMFSMYGWLAVKWLEPRLTWQPEEYGGVDFITTYPSTIWTPDLGMINSVDHLYGDLLNFGEYRGKVTNTGWVRIVTAGTLQTTCILDVTYFPFDEQVCHIEIDSWTEPTSQLTLSADAARLKMTRLRPNEQWQFVQHWIHSEKTSVYAPEFGYSHYQTISFVFRIKRKSMYMGTNFLLPCIGVVFMELIVFWLPPDSGEKISLGITLLLAQTVYQLIMQGDIPQTSDSVPLINVYILICMVLSALIILTSTVVLSVHHRRQGKVIPWWVKYLIRGKRAAHLNICTKTTKDKHSQGQWFNCSDDQFKPVKKDAVYQAPKDIVEDPDGQLFGDVARALDRIFFYLYLTILSVATASFLLLTSLAQQPVMAPIAGYGYQYRGERT